MPRPIIAVDIDDVLAHHAEAIVAYSNKFFGPGHTMENYTEHWSLFWGVNTEETRKRALEYHLSDDMVWYKAREGALLAMQMLSKRFDLVVVTSRRKEVISVTSDWINSHFPNIFKNIYHVGLWDVITEDSHLLTKADICVELGVSYLIDDQIKHCNAVADVGIHAVLFGNYPWQDETKLGLNKYVYRCHDWTAVLEYFDGQPQ